MGILETTSVTKRYDTGSEIVTALDEVSFDIKLGEFVSVVGPSGSGKTTLLNILGLLDTPSEGTVSLNNKNVTSISEQERTRARKRTIGFVFQQFYLIPTLTATENVSLPILHDRDPETSNIADDLLTSVGLGDRLDHRPNELSGGQKQRVAIARALINEPDVVLTDEPTGNLDRDTGRTILEKFGEIQSRDVAIVGVTHDPLVSEYADRSIELMDGKIATSEQLVQ